MVPRLNRLTDSRAELAELLRKVQVEDTTVSVAADQIELHTKHISECLDDLSELLRQAIVVGSNADAWTPASYFESLWISRPRLLEWINAGDMDKRYIHGRLHVKPKEFFARLDREGSDAPALTGVCNRTTTTKKG